MLDSALAQPLSPATESNLREPGSDRARCA
jgi:hypothetical protein